MSASWRFGGDVVVSGILAFVLLCAFIAVAKPEPMPPPTSAPPVSALRFVPGNPPIATLDSAQRELRISEHAPRDLLVCMRGDCRLVEEWLGK